MPVINTAQNNYNKVSIDSVPSTYANAAAVLTKTAPSVGVLFDQSITGIASQAPSLLYVMPFLVSATTAQTGIGMRVLGWRKYLEASTGDFWHIPTVLADLTLTFTSGSVPNYTIDAVANTRTFSGIVQVGGTPSGNLYSPATAAGGNVEPAAAMIDLAGSQIVTVQFKSSGTPTMGTFWSIL